MRVAGYKPGELAVSIGGKKVIGKTAPALAVSVNTADLSMATEGDAVNVQGWYDDQHKPNAGNMQPGYAVAQSLSVKLSRPLRTTKKLKPPPVKSPRKNHRSCPKSRTPSNAAQVARHLAANSGLLVCRAVIVPRCSLRRSLHWRSLHWRSFAHYISAHYRAPA